MKLMTVFKKEDLHPGRSGRTKEKPIKCIYCDWTPDSNEVGGVRWKMLAKHYEEHIVELVK